MADKANSLEIASQQCQDNSTCSFQGNHEIQRNNVAICIWKITYEKVKKWQTKGLFELIHPSVFGTPYCRDWARGSLKAEVYQGWDRLCEGLPLPRRPGEEEQVGTKREESCGTCGRSQTLTKLVEGVAYLVLCELSCRSQREDGLHREGLHAILGM